MGIGEQIYYVTISRDEYNELLNDQRMLNALQNAGVDNWCGYEFAMELYFNGEDE